MVKVEKGGTYSAARARSGESSRGPWELVVVKADGRARQKITIFPTNMPTGIQDGESFIVKEINGVEVKQKQDGNGEWRFTDTQVYAELERIKPVDLDDFGGDLGDLEGLL